MPKISVIVPVYKVEQYLHRCVDSILMQSFRDFELILVDDGSPDSCGSICDGYAASNPAVHVLHQENGGLSAARNTGIDWVMNNSDSQWLAFVDSDDWVHRDYLKRLYEAVEDTGCRISMCFFRRTGGEPLPDSSDGGVCALGADDFYCTEQVSSGNVVVAWNKLYHRSLFRKLRFPVGKLNEDEFTTYRAVYEAEKVAVVLSELYAYYQNPNGIMLSQWNPRRLHILEAIEEQVAFAKEQENSRFYARGVKHYIFSIHEQLNAAQKAYHKELRKKMRNALKQGRACGVFPLCWNNLWAYEEGYPVKLFWWPIFQGRRLLDRLMGKGI